MFKICIVGQINVGKTSLLLKFVDNTFSDASELTINNEFKSHILKIDRYSIKMQVW